MNSINYCIVCGEILYYNVSGKYWSTRCCDVNYNENINLISYSFRIYNIYYSFCYFPKQYILKIMSNDEIIYNNKFEKILNYGEAINLIEFDILPNMVFK